VCVCVCVYVLMCVCVRAKHTGPFVVHFPLRQQKEIVGSFSLYFEYSFSLELGHLSL